MSASGIRDLKIEEITAFYGKPYPFDFYPDSFKISMTTNLKRVKETGKIIEQEAFVVDLEGNELWYHSTLIPVNDANGQLDYIMVISLETTERKQIEQEREKILAELEDKNNELERFTYTVSHDLKSPLVTIKGFLGALRQDAAQGNTERLEADIVYISKAADKRGRLLDELLQLSRIGRMMNAPEKVPLTDLARQAVDLVTGHITARGVEVTIEPGMPVVYGDRIRLLEVYQNLIENAVKFMGTQQASRVEIGARLDDRAALCWVRDNGMGIAPVYHERVFGLFNRLDAKTEGTGIGLALVKRIVDVHGGRIWVESEGQEQGSTFLFTLPLSGDNHISRSGTSLHST